MNYKTFISAALLCPFLVAPAHGQQYEGSAEPAKTLRAAAYKAIASNPEVQERWHAYLASASERRVARGNYFPRLDVSGSIGDEQYNFSPAGGGPEVDQSFSPRRLNVTLSQMIYDGMATPNEVRRLGFVQTTRYYDLLDKAEEITLEAYRAYEDVMRFRKLVALAEDNVGLHQQVYDQILDRVRAGVARSVDFEQANGRLALARSNLITEQTNLHDVSARYQRIVGELPAPDLAPVPAMRAPVPGDISAALNAAYADNHAINAAAEAISAADADVRVRRAGFLPRLDVRVSGEFGDETERQFGESDDVVAELVLSYNLFNGGSDQAQVEQYVNEEKRAEYLRVKTCRDVRQTLKIAYNDLIELKVQLEHLRVHEESIARAREAYRKQFEIGQRTLLDLLDTENEYFEARRAHAAGKVDYALARARTLAAMGRLMAALDVRRADLPSLAEIRPGGESRKGLLCPAEAPASAPADPDTDGDGVRDSKDRCPGTPRGTPVDEFGCAIPVIGDEDRDGVPDPVDLCPGTPPGTVVDATGCPENQEIVLRGVNFALNTARITPDSRAVLEQVAAVLLGQPALRVEVAGHTDSTGAAAYNLELSRRRAAAVVDFLAGLGVERGRMQAMGYGLTQPIASNDTAAGRAQNRRVAIQVIEGGS